MDIGQIIKLLRINKGLTQSELAEDICSITHLSKIENGSKEANEESLNLLLERLGSSYDQVFIDYGRSRKQLEELEKELIYGNFKNADEIVTSIESNEEYFIYVGTGALYYLSLVKYYLLVDKVSKTDSYFTILNKLKKSLSSEELKKLQFVRGLRLLKEKDYKAAIVKFEECFDELPQNKGEIYYYYALCRGQLNQFGEAIEFAYKALDIFRILYNYERINHCNLLLGIILTQLKAYTKAEEYFNQTIYHSKLMNDKRSEMIAMHNLGRVLKKNKQNQEAAEIFQKCMDYYSKCGQENEFLHSLAELAELQYSQGIDTAIELIEEILLKCSPKKNSHYYYLFKTYKYNLENQERDLARFLTSHAIPYFKENGKNDQLFYCYKLLIENRHATKEVSVERIINEIINKVID
ncbi:helix-turn-helix domain-containing protein [Bacillus sp. FJAT-45037]|uniref:helix-turn-helix domain-containing protein n=1 Tax=Bacillus sp. FJAT-45037 TaxID=2011007 RepID=UPI0018E2829F|nr:helix-turn-helix transcriptional regulator [Bacillus sp. FJAT-45037]